MHHVALCPHPSHWRHQCACTLHRCVILFILTHTTARVLGLLRSCSRAYDCRWQVPCLLEFFETAPKCAHSLKLKGLDRTSNEVFRPSNFRDWAQLWARHITGFLTSLLSLLCRPVYDQSRRSLTVSATQSVQLAAFAATYVS
jgi:hypothetical protein